MFRHVLRLPRRRFSTSTSRKPVCLSYTGLVNGQDFSAEIEEAFGYDGLGLLTVEGIPDLVEFRSKCLPMAREFATMPEETKAKYEHKDSFYGFGWSHGKEVLEGRPDYAKGSFYANPLLDEPVNDPKLIKAFPSYCSPNIWPDEELPTFKSTFKNLGTLMASVGALVAIQCDKYVSSKSSSYPPNSLEHQIRDSCVHKARLLHYFPLASSSSFTTSSSSSSSSSTDNASNSNSNKGSNDMSSWCGWHNDHGALTSLTSSMYLDANGEATSSPDPTAGLYIKTRTGGVVQVTYPEDRLAFQIGEAAQILSGGLLQATPHAVRGPQGSKAAHVSRNQLALFMQPMWHQVMDVPVDRLPSDAEKGSSHEFLPQGMPTLRERWSPGIDFGTFTNQTLAKYH